jgi:hypothetical protein
MLWYKRSLNTAGGNCWSHCASRGSLGRTSNLSASKVGAFTKSFCLRTNFKSTFNYQAIVDSAAKIHFASAVITQRKTDRKWLLGLEWHKKLNRPYAGKLPIFAPLDQRREYFVEDHDPRHQRCTREMPWQTGMISANRAANFKDHSRLSHASFTIVSGK